MTSMFLKFNFPEQQHTLCWPHMPTLKPKPTQMFHPVLRGRVSLPSPLRMMKIELLKASAKNFSIKIQVSPDT